MYSPPPCEIFDTVLSTLRLPFIFSQNKFCIERVYGYLKLTDVEFSTGVSVKILNFQKYFILDLMHEKLL